MKIKNLLVKVLFLLVTQMVVSQESKPPGYESPILNSDNTIEFNVYAPKAENVQLIGTFPSDKTTFTKSENGLWSLRIGPVDPEIYHYQFDVDGLIIADPRNQSPYPWLFAKSELIVPGSPALMHEELNVPHGVLHEHSYFSETLKGTTKVRIYTPPNYNSNNTKEYPVLFLLHGFGEQVSFWSDFGKINTIADNLISKSNIVAPIIVMPEGDPLKGEYHKFLTGQADGNAWMENNMEVLHDVIVKDLFPFLESNYKVKLEKESTAICGSSMGGIQAVKLGVKNADRFGWVIGLSTSLNVPPFEIEHKDQINALNLLQFNIGEKDTWGFGQSTKVHDWLNEKGIRHEYKVSKGGHDWDVWRKDMIDLLKVIFK